MTGGPAASAAPPEAPQPSEPSEPSQLSDSAGPAPSWARRWLADLAMGARFALGGGREGWTRTVLTAVGVGLGVAVLLVATSVPHMLSALDAREAARTNAGVGPMKKSDRTLLFLETDTEYRGADVLGRTLRPDGAHPPVPPGLDEVPGPGEMAVSPALKELLDSPDGKLLRERLPARITATIGDQGLLGPFELLYYAGSDGLTPGPWVDRIDSFRTEDPDPPSSALLMLLITVICVVLLMPVAAFVGAAVRFGGERRDRRLAAMRLVGADSRMTKRIAAGEAATGAVLGLLVGTLIFLPLRQLMGEVHPWDFTAFPADMRPSAGLAALIAVAVPLGAVLVSLVALRGVAIEPLGVVRRAGQQRRRLWWRLVPVVVGLVLLFPLMDGISDLESEFETYQIAAGVTLILLGVNTLLPWLVEAAAGRLRGGRLPFQLAVRRLQSDSGTASRAVSGITVAVAGAIALQMLFTGVADEDEKQAEAPGSAPAHAQMMISFPAADGPPAPEAAADLAATRGVDRTLGRTMGYALRSDLDPLKAESLDTVTVADCALLRQLAGVGSCENGDVFVAEPLDPSYAEPTSGAKAGAEVNLAVSWDYPPENGSDRGEPALWTVPEDARTVQLRDDPTGVLSDGILATPAALDASLLVDATTDVYIHTDGSTPDAEEFVRNAAAALGPTAVTSSLEVTDDPDDFSTVERGLRIGAIGILLLIGASMVVATLEQLQERKRLLSVLVAFGTRRSTLAWSVLWQTAMPVLVGLALAVAFGLGLGTILLRMSDLPLTVGWTALAAMATLGGLMVVLVTLLSMPALWRMMRADGLRTE